MPLSHSVVGSLLEFNVLYHGKEVYLFFIFFYLPGTCFSLKAVTCSFGSLNFLSSVWRVCWMLVCLVYVL